MIGEGEVEGEWKFCENGVIMKKLVGGGNFVWITERRGYD